MHGLITCLMFWQLIKGMSSCQFQNLLAWTPHAASSPPEISLSHVRVANRLIVLGYTQICYIHAVAPHKGPKFILAPAFGQELQTGSIVLDTHTQIC